jgi:hypothetical protein
MNWLTIALRLVHIFAGVLWAGAAFAFASFLTPAVRMAGPDGARFMQTLATKTRHAASMGAAALLNTGAGLWLFWRDSGGLRPAWLGTPTGLALALGGISGLAAAVIGFAVQFRSTLRLQAIAAQAQKAGGPPNEAQMKEISLLQARLRAGGVWVAALLAITVATMATARYLAF